MNDIIVSPITVSLIMVYMIGIIFLGRSVVLESERDRMREFVYTMLIPSMIIISLFVDVLNAIG